MHTIIHPLNSSARSAATKSTTSVSAFRQPNYDCQEHADTMKLVVYVPGVDAAGIEIEAAGPDLTVTAKKSHFVRVNWQSLHLETVQRDYQLRLRLGSGFDYAAMQAEIHLGVLTVTLPKRQTVAAPRGNARLRRAAA
jgi:HSP20 family molecular chaperone IbpA